VLTPAEWRVVEAVRHGMSNPEIAKRQAVSLDAIKFHVANALQKLGYASRKDLRLWNGVQRGSNLSSQETKMDGYVSIGAVGQVARSVNNIEDARTWYRDVLGLRHLYSFGNLAFFDCDGLRLFLSEGDGPASDSILYFRVDDVRSAASILTARGINFINAPHMIHKHEDGTEEWMAFFHDNEERPLAIMSRAKPPAPSA
jgi:catechol 2,3-dioxygenase-like lactoylglutathione lyase family enzyme